MRTQDDLRAALAMLERHAPSAETVLRGVRTRAAKRRRWRAPGLVVAAASATAAAIFAATSAITASPSGGHSAAVPPSEPSARAILLTAAASAARVPMTGNYWRTDQITGFAAAAGTSARPYNVMVRSSQQQWDPRKSGQRSWLIARNLPTVPAPGADKLAWQTAGSPGTWNLGGTVATTQAGRWQAWWQPGNGTIGYLNMTPAQYLALPSDPVRLQIALVRRVTGQTGPAKPGTVTVRGLPVGQWWEIGVALLQDPLTPQVRSAVFKMLAGLPGVHVRGEMRDPLGRLGYGLAMPDNDAVPRTEDLAVFDPSAGLLLADETVVLTPAKRGIKSYTSGSCSAYGKGPRGCASGQESGGAAAQQSSL